MLFERGAGRHRKEGGKHRKETKSGKNLIIAASAGAALSALAAASIDKIPDNAAEEVSAFAFDKIVGNCPQVPAAASLAIESALEKEPYWYSSKDAEKLAKSLGVEVLAREEINNTQLAIMDSPSKDQALAKFDNFTSKNFGFNTIAANKAGKDDLEYTAYPDTLDINEIKNDLTNYTKELSDLPVELVRKSNIKEMVLVGELNNEDIDIDPSGLAGEDAIYLEPGGDSVILKHEISHKLDEEFCGSELAAHNDKAFKKLQPNWLTDKERNRIWKSQDHETAALVTNRIYGIRNDSEDKAVLSEDILSGNFTGDELVRKKKAFLAGRYEALVPGSMTYLAALSTRK